MGGAGSIAHKSGTAISIWLLGSCYGALQVVLVLLREID